jgi:hypothetical protein
VRAVAGQWRAVVVARLAARGLAGAHVHQVSAAVTDNEVLRKHALRPERCLHVGDGRSAIHPVDLFVENAGVHRLARADRIRDVAAACNHRRKHVVVARVFEGASHGFCAGNTKRLADLLHRFDLAVVAISRRCSGIDLDRVAIPHIGTTGRHGPCDVPIVRLPQHRAEREPGRMQLSGMYAVFVVQRALELDVWIREQNRRAQGAARLRHRPGVRLPLRTIVSGHAAFARAFNGCVCGPECSPAHRDERHEIELRCPRGARSG